MQEILNDAARWDAGCGNDKVRNEFVIPHVSQLLNAMKPKTILDVGSGTGFTARHIDQKLNYRPDWVLLDSNSERLALAAEKRPSNMKSEFICGNFLSAKAVDRKFDALFFGFTLLELGAGDEILSRIDSLCAQGGAVIVAQPDVMQDVLASGDSDADLLKRFTAGPVDLRKVDKFTQAEYPFHAERFESVTYKVMQLGFTLKTFGKEIFDESAVFLLAFVRRD